MTQPRPDVNTAFHAAELPLRICYVVSFFHPFASGAERQALAQGASWPAADTSFMW